MLTGTKDIENPALEGEVFLRHILNLSRAKLYIDLNVAFDPAKKTNLDGLIKRRLEGEPLAYIINSREFYGLELFVDNRVLIPRPETELLVEESIRFCNGRPNVVLADIGTGSGAISISLAVHLPEVKIYATDISPQALEVARFNAQKQGVETRLTFLSGDLLEPIQTRLDAVIANLPYVKTSDWEFMPSAAFEPRLALDGGESGLEQLFRLIDQLQNKVNPGGCVLLEIGMGQADAVTDYLKRAFPVARINVIKDLAEIERVIRVIL
jgi:release factor glutamine methyltransferase